MTVLFWLFTGLVLVWIVATIVDTHQNRPAALIKKEKQLKDAEKRRMVAELEHSAERQSALNYISYLCQMFNNPHVDQETMLVQWTPEGCKQIGAELYEAYKKLGGK